MSYYSEMAARQMYDLKTIDRIFEKAMREKDEEISKLKGLLEGEGRVIAVLVARNEKLMEDLSKVQRDAMDRIEELKEKMVEVILERDKLLNSKCFWQREAARANEKAEKMEAAWQAASKEASEYTEEILKLREELATFQHITKDLTPEDIRVARKLKFMNIHINMTQRNLDWKNRADDVYFTIDHTPYGSKENDLWKHLRSIL